MLKVGVNLNDTFNINCARREMVKTMCVFSFTDTPSTGRFKNGYVFQEMGA